MNTEKKTIWISPSSNNMLDTCPYKFKANKIEKSAKYDAGLKAMLGTTVHNLTQGKVMIEYLNEGCMTHVTPEEFEEEFMRVLPVYFYKQYDSAIFNTIAMHDIIRIEDQHDSGLEEGEQTLREKYYVWRDEILSESTFKSDTTKMFLSWTNTTNNMIDAVGAILVDNNVVEVQSELKRFIKLDDTFGVMYITDLRAYTADNELIIIELKTSSKTVKDLQVTNMEQILFYKKFIREELEVEQIKYFIIYSCCLKTKQECYTIDVTEFEHEDYNKVFDDKFKLLKYSYENDLFPTKFSQSCSYCNVKHCVACKDGDE
ncbi:MAG: PD-(D/E)XK nuclease family protein [Cetobacterium somerae]